MPRREKRVLNITFLRSFTARSNILAAEIESIKIVLGMARNMRRL